VIVGKINIMSLNYINSVARQSGVLKRVANSIRIFKKLGVHLAQFSSLAMSVLVFLLVLLLFF